MQEFLVLTVVLVLALGAYWSLVIFPRQREFQKQQKYVRALQPGDEMITFGGIIGKVIALDTDQGTALVEIADGVIIKMVAASLLRPFDPSEVAEASQKGETTPKAESEEISPSIL